MKMINAIRNLKAYHIAEFKANQADDAEVNIVSDKTDCLFTCKMGELEDFFKRNDVEEVFTDENDIISFMSPETTLQIAGADYLWHIAPVRNTKYKRLEKLFHSEDIEKPKEKPKSQRAIYTIQIAEFDKDDNIVDEPYVIQGTKSEFIGSINQAYTMTLLKSQFEHQAKFRLTDDEPWLTFEEMKEKGVFIV